MNEFQNTELTYLCHMKHNLLIILLFLSFYASEAQVLNIERERIKTDTTGWSGTGKLTFNLISNTKKFTEGGLRTHIQFKTKRSLCLALTEYELIKSEDDDFSNKGMVHLRYNYKLNSVLTAEAFTQAQFNKVLNLNFRGLTGAGLRAKVLGFDNFRLYTGAAYMFEYEEPVAPNPHEYNHRLSSYLSFTIKVNSGFSLINTLYYQPLLSGFSDYRISTNLDMVIRISKKLSYVTTLEYLSDNRPLPEMPRNIYSFKNSLLFDFGR